MDIIAQRKLQKAATATTEATGKSCPECLLPDKGAHKCSPAALPSLELLDSNESKSEEERAAQIIRQKLTSEATTACGKKYGSVKLATGGHPISIEVKKPKMKPTATGEWIYLIKLMKL